jgi:rsbT co-antagonist protein RsbR
MAKANSRLRSHPDVEKGEKDERGEKGEKDEKGEMKEHGTQVNEARPRAAATDGELLPELVEYLRQNREDLREEWVGRITDAELLEEMGREEIFSEASALYDNYVDALETGSVETLQGYARDLSERIIARDVETDQVLGIVLLLRDVLERSLFANYGQDAEVLNQILDAYEPAANRIMVTVGVSFVEERERVIRQQQEAIRKLSTPVMKLRERLLLLPIIGALDKKRIRQLTEQLLEAIQEQRAQVVVVDITGVAEVDGEVANHLVQTVEAAALMGAETIVTGLSSEIARTLVDLEVELGTIRTVGDLQGGLEDAERLLGQARDEGVAPR